MMRAKERGSVVGFVVVGLLLTALVLGGIYGVKNYMTNAKNVADDVKDSGKKVVNNTADEAKKSSEEAKKAEQQRRQEQVEEEKKVREQREEQKAEEAKRSAEKKEPSESAQGVDEKPLSSGADTDDAPESATETQPSSQSSSPLPTTGVEALPQTGPAEMAISAVGLSALFGSVLAYRRSNQL